MQAPNEKLLCVHSRNFVNLSSGSFLYSVQAHLLQIPSLLSDFPLDLYFRSFLVSINALYHFVIPRALSHHGSLIFVTSIPICFQKLKSDKILQIIQLIYFMVEILYAALSVLSPSATGHKILCHVMLQYLVIKIEVYFVLCTLRKIS